MLKFSCISGTKKLVQKTKMSSHSETVVFHPPAPKRRNRSNYRCSKCGQPKKGHVCPYQPRVVRADGEPAPEMISVATQVEIDARLVVRHLELENQGCPESYGETM